MKTCFKATEENLALLFTECYQSVCFYAFSILNDMQDAEDIADQCFLNIWERNSEFVSIDNAKSYLFACVHNSSINELRRRKKEAAYANELHHVASTTVLPEENSETAVELEDILNLLSPGRRKVFTLIYRDGKSLSEIADLLNISVNTVKNHRKQGISVLRKILKPIFFK